MTTDDPVSRDPHRLDRGPTSRMSGLGTLTAMAASALLVPESAMAQGTLGPGAPSAPVAAPGTPPATAPVTAPQAPKASGYPITLNGDIGATTAPSEPKGSGFTVTITGTPSAITAPSTTAAPQKPSSSDGKR